MAIDAQLVFYSGNDTPYIPITSGQELQTILQNIDTAINTHNTAPDYSAYDLFCVTQTDGTSHPTNTQNFAEGISKNLCDFLDTYDAFISGTYATDTAVFTSAIAGLQSPELTYSNFGIIDSDTITQVYTKMFAGFTTIINAQNPSSGTWATLSITPPTTITTGFNSLIAYIVTMNTAISGKQATIANIDNSGNCLSAIGGTNSDTIRATVLLLTTLACSLPSYVAGDVTWGGVSTGTTLQNSIQNVVSSISSILTNGVVAAGTGLVLSAVGSTYQGKKLTLDTTYIPIYKTMVTVDDETPGYLSTKIVAGDGITVVVTDPGDDETLTISNSYEQGLVLVNSADDDPDFLLNKVPSTFDSNWGFSMNSSAATTNETLQLIVTLGDPYLFSQALMNYWATNPDLLAQFAGLVALSASAPGTPVSDLVASRSTLDIDLVWEHKTGSAQNAKWRQVGNSAWILSDFEVPNPLGASVEANTLLTPVVNIVHDFQVDTIYSLGTVGSNISQMVVYTAQTLTHTVASGIISVNQSPIPGIQIIDYRLKSGSEVLQNVSTSGSIPNISFSSVVSGTYSVEYRYGTSVNGSVLYSTDASQSAAWYSHAVVF